jgi:quinoprotein glucose dehydrogenase
VLGVWGEAQKKTSDPAASDWPAYGRDAGGSRYSPLSEINRENVHRLKVAWTYRTGDVSNRVNARSTSAFQCTPILIDNTLFVSTPFNRVIALDPATGAERWVYDPRIDLKRNYHNQLVSRGLATWLDTRVKEGQPCRRRIFAATNDARLIAIDAATGRPCEDFGLQGQIDLTPGIGVSETDPGEYQVTSPPAVIRDLVVVGSAIGDNNRVSAPSGAVRAFDARSGRLRWSWEPLSVEMSRAKAKKKDASFERGTANVWSIMSVDEERDLIFLPTGNTSPDYFGGVRRGSDYYASSVVALRGSTGKVVWHFQTVHHDLWDYDVPAQPSLITIRRDGRDIPAVAVPTKVGHLFILHRETGKPLFPVEERPVPQGGVAGEPLSPTQPFPVLPPPLVPQRLTVEDAFGLTPEDRKACSEQIAALRTEGVFTPPSVQGTIVYPGDVGGMTWGGASFDPRRGLLITNVNRAARVVWLVPREEYDPQKLRRLRTNFTFEIARQEGTPFALRREFLFRPSMVPCNQPPWGTLIAVDLATGKIRWEVPLGVTPELRSIPESAKWGSLNLGGSIVTAGGLIFISAARDNIFRAFDVETGRELWKMDLPAGGHATPMTYSASGRQFVVIAAGGHGRLNPRLGDYVIAYALE